MSRLQKELLDQKNKLTRAERELKTAKKAIKQRIISSEFFELYDRDLDLRELEQRNQNVLNQLGDIAYADDEMGPKIARHILNRGMKMPHMLQKSRSSLSWRSDTSYDAMSISSSKGWYNFQYQRKSQIMLAAFNCLVLNILFISRNIYFTLITI